MRRPTLILGLLLAMLSLPATSADRPFPANTKRGVMSPAPYPEIIIGGETRRLAAGSRIWNEDNLIQMPASLRGSDLIVNYTENFEGEVDRVWILAPEEAREPLARQTNSPLK